MKEIIAANASFEQGLYQKNIIHSGQPSLVQVVSNCEKRTIGTNGGFGYKAMKEEMEIALLDNDTDVSISAGLFGDRNISDSWRRFIH